MKQSFSFENRDLAHVMASAEHQHRLLALSAAAIGLESEEQRITRLADRIGIAAGKNYLLELLGILDEQEKEMLGDERVIRATYGDFRSHHFVYQGQPHLKAATRAWNSLAFGQKVFDKYGLENVLLHGDQPHRGLCKDVIAINIDEEVLKVLPDLRECGIVSQTFISDFYQTKLAETVESQ